MPAANNFIAGFGCGVIATLFITAMIYIVTYKQCLVM